jgi:hypothetical protein
VADLYTDEDVGSDLVSTLRIHGHRLTRTVDVGRSGAQDADQLAYAVRRGLILLTHNTNDFRKLHHIWRHWMPLGLPPHPGIVAVPQPRPPLQDYTHEVAARLIHDLLESGQHIANEFHRWHRDHGWTQ